MGEFFGRMFWLNVLGKFFGGIFWVNFFGNFFGEFFDLQSFNLGELKDKNVWFSRSKSGFKCQIVSKFNLSLWRGVNVAFT